MNQISSNHATDQKKMLEKFGGLSIVLVAAMAALLLALTLSSCSNDPFTGNWKLDSMTTGSTTASSSDLAQLGIENAYSLELKGDKTGTFTVDGMEINVTWEAKDETNAILYFPAAGSAPMHLSDGKLTLDWQDDNGPGTLVFVKS